MMSKIPLRSNINTVTELAFSIFAIMCCLSAPDEESKTQVMCKEVFYALILSNKEH